MLSGVADLDLFFFALGLALGLACALTPGFPAPREGRGFGLKAGESERMERDVARGGATLVVVVLQPSQGQLG